MKEINIEENIENRIIDLITKGSEDRLIAFKPKEDTESIDLVVKKRGEYEPSITPKHLGVPSKIRRVFSTLSKAKSRELFFQVNILIGHSKTENIVKDILQKSFVPNKDFYLMFIHFDEVKQDVSNVWIIPSFMFSEITESQKSEDNKIILRFETTIIPENKDKYARFLIDKKNLGRFLLEIIETKGNISFIKNIFSENKTINLEKLGKFIIKARENIYITNSRSIENPRLYGSLQFEYQEADYFYQNIYFTGSKILVGQEIVYYNNRPIWAMNYFGGTVEKEILTFLKESLLKLSQECRFGKNCQFDKRELKYQDKGQGSLEYFSGKEQIYQKNKEIYNLTYQGGLI